jgi:hypothetical protein
MKYLLLLVFVPLMSAHSAEEPQNFLKRCYRKEYSEKQKSTKAMTFAVYENIDGDIFGTVQVEFKNTNGPTKGLAHLTCVTEKENLHCKSTDDGGKVSFVDEGGKGVLKIEDPVTLKVYSSYFPGKSTVSRLPANASVKLEMGIANACEKLVE